MNVCARVIGPVVFAAVLASCTPFPKHTALGPWASRPAPPIDGVDSAGRPLRLSDHQGKVVLVSFWSGT